MRDIIGTIALVIAIMALALVSVNTYMVWKNFKVDSKQWLYISNLAGNTVDWMEAHRARHRVRTLEVKQEGGIGGGK